MIVPSCSRGPRGAPTRQGGEQAVLAHQPQHPPPGCVDAAVAQPRPDLAVALAVEGAGGEDGADRLSSAASAIAPTGPLRREGGSVRGGKRWR
jgi:hypothetical protein